MSTQDTTREEIASHSLKRGRTKSAWEAGYLNMEHQDEIETLARKLCGFGKRKRGGNMGPQTSLVISRTRTERRSSWVAILRALMFLVKTP